MHMYKVTRTGSTEIKDYIVLLLSVPVTKHTVPNTMSTQNDSALARNTGQATLAAIQTFSSPSASVKVTTSAQ